MLLLLLLLLQHTQLCTRARGCKAVKIKPCLTPRLPDIKLTIAAASAAAP
jgi:hypothetical protein